MSVVAAGFVVLRFSSMFRSARLNQTLIGVLSQSLQTPPMRPRHGAWLWLV